MNNAEKYYFERTGDMFIRPLRVRVKLTFTSSGAVVTPSTTRRQSHPGLGASGSAGSYALTGLPLGSDYHIEGCTLVPPTGTQLVNIANVLSFDASLGTLTVKTRRSDTGAEAAPADNSVLYLTIGVESGAPS